MKTFATLFSGCEGAGVGLRNAGLTELWGIENNPKAAAIAHLNGFDTHVVDITTANFALADKPDWLHGSPPCQNASVANHSGVEGPEDKAVSDAVCRAIAVLQPKIFTLENVAGYRRFSSFWDIVRSLESNGYEATWQVIDAANYGVPQNRCRLWLVASRVSTPVIPSPTHEKPSSQLCWLELKDWVSWDEALLENWQAVPYKLSDRMLQMIPADFSGCALMAGWHQYTGRGQGGLTVRNLSQPAPCIIAKAAQASMQPLVICKEKNSLVEAYCLSLKNTAALQSFPADYRWGDDLTAARRAIGNAVPSLLIQRIAEANIPQSMAEIVEKKEEAIA